MATLFRYDYQTVLYRMTFAQCITLIQVRNNREKRQARQAEEASKNKSSGLVNGFDQDKDPELSDISDLVIDEDDPSTIPYIDDVLKAFGGQNMMSSS